MSDRLSELRRQRALIAEHLAWLDREIAASSGPDTPDRRATSRDASLRPGVPVPPAKAARPPLSEAEMETLLSPYRTPATSVKQDVRKGCLLYFCLGLVLLALGVIALAFLLRAP